jgi:hypothetical protein
MAAIFRVGVTMNWDRVFDVMTVIALVLGVAFGIVWLFLR